MARPIYILVEEGLLNRFDRARMRYGYNRSVAIREAMRQFVEKVERAGIRRK